MALKFNPTTGALDTVVDRLDALLDVDATTVAAKNDTLIFNGTKWAMVPAGTSFVFSIASFTCNAGGSQNFLIGSGEWKAIGALSFSASYNNGPATGGYVSCSGYSNLTLTNTFQGPTTNTQAIAYPSVAGTRAFTLNATDGSASPTSTITYTFVNNIFYGGSTKSGSYTEADIEGLDVTTLTNDPTQIWNTLTLQAGEYVIFAIPSRLSIASLYDYGTGFEAAFTLITSTLSITNTAGFGETYKVYRSNNPLGPGTFRLETR